MPVDTVLSQTAGTPSAASSLPSGFDPEARRDRRAAWIVGLVGCALFLPALGTRDLWSSGEARVAQAARQMRRTGDWVVPRLGDAPRLKKPPLAYWMVLLASLPFDAVEEGNSRLPSAAAGVGALLVTLALGRCLFGRRAGMLGALALGTTLLVWREARTTGIEMPLLFFDLLALYGWWRYHDARRSAAASDVRGWPWLLLAYGALGFAFLLKGPVGPLLVLLIASAYLTAAGAWRRPGVRWRHHLLGLGLFLVVAVPWYLALLVRLPDAWTVWRHEFFGRVEGFDHLEPWWYFLGKVLADGQPWILFALLGVGMLVRADGATRRRLLLPAVWAGVTMLFFSIPASKKHYYILPVYPALALLAGFLFDRALAGAMSHRFRIAIRGVLALLGAALAMAGLATLGLLALRPELLDRIGPGGMAERLPASLFVTVGAVATGLGAGLLVTARRNRLRLGFGLLCVAAAASFAVRIAILPRQNRHKGDRLVCGYVRPRLRPEDRVVTFHLSGRPVFTWYLDHPVTRADDVVALYRDWLRVPAAGATYVLSKDKHLAPLWRTYAVEPERGASVTITPDHAEALRALPQVDAVWMAPDTTPPCLLVRLRRDASKEENRVDAVEAGKTFLHDLGSDLPVRIVPLASLLRPVDHPPPANGARWGRRVGAGRRGAEAAGVSP